MSRTRLGVQLSPENRTHVGVCHVTFTELFVDPIIIRLLGRVSVVVNLRTDNRQTCVLSFHCVHFVEKFTHFFFFHTNSDLTTTF